MKEKHKLVHTINKTSRPGVEPATSRIWQHCQHEGNKDANHQAKSPSTKTEGSMTRVVRSAPQYPARNLLVNHTTTKVS
jgi:hypothetical protein